MKWTTAEAETEAAAAPQALDVQITLDTDGHSFVAGGLVAPRTREEVEERYVAARDEWTEAMRAANSGRLADLASLAIAQETFEAAGAERERWIAGAEAAIPMDVEASHRDLKAAVDQEMAWRNVHRHKPDTLLDPIRRRIGR